MDVPGVKEIGFHEPLHGEQMHRTAVAEVPGRRFLQVIGQMVVLPFGQIVDLIAEPPEEVPGTEENGKLSGADGPAGNEFGERKNAEVREG